MYSALPARNQVIEDFWGIDVLSIDSRRRRGLQGDSYFRYQEEQFKLASYNGRKFRSVATYGILLAIIQEFRDKSLDFKSVRDWLRQRLQRDETSCNSLSTDESVLAEDVDELSENVINLAMRLWLMMPIGGFRQVCGPERVVAWNQGPINEFLIKQFPKSRDLKEPTTLEKVFNARNLKHLGGIRIIWTNNLDDHLRLQDDDTKVSIFHHATFLLYCRSW
jgi:hypothetical protein